MKTLTVEIPEAMEADIEQFLEDHPQYLDTSDLVQEALRRVNETPRFSERTLG